MQVETTPLDGLLVLTPKVFEDNRGFFFETYNEERFRQAGIHSHWAQDNHVRSAKNTVRGLHFQLGKGQAKLIRCILGRVWDVAVDIRRDSPTLGKWFGIELTAETKRMLYVPEGFAHGYTVLSDEADTLYKCSTVYDPALESEIRWNDPDLAIQWPVRSPVLSPRDVEARTFRDYLESPR
jgi:dTDP-4-dehydrorhamnose 3,5-epimerase